VNQGQYKSMMAEVAKNQGLSLNVAQVVKEEERSTDSVAKVAPKTQAQNVGLDKAQIKVKDSINDRFNKDKQNLLLQTENYLRDNKNPPQINKDYRSEVTSAVESGNIGLAIKSLEKLRDQKSGVILHEIEKDGNNPIIIRDARNCEVPPKRSTEAFEMQYLNIIRSGMDIAEIENKPELKKELQERAVEFIQEFHKENKGLSQKEMLKKSNEGIVGIVNLFNNFGVENAHFKLNKAKDFQNLNDIHADIVTISSIESNGETHTVVEAEVALRGLTAAQKKRI